MEQKEVFSFCFVGECGFHRITVFDTLENVRNAAEKYGLRDVTFHRDKLYSIEDWFG